MKALIVGYGTVGTSQAFVLNKLGHQIFIYDPYKGYNDIEKDVDIVFICTMEDAVEEAVRTIVSEGVKGLITIKSTIIPGTTKALMRKYNRHICHNPEFIREKHAFEDALNPSRVVIGECCSFHGDLLENLYKPLTQLIYRTDPTTSELIKLVTNALRALSISFWNEIYMLASQIGVDIGVLTSAADPGKVLGEWEGGRWGVRVLGKPYGGKCLPKDVKHLINLLKKYNLTSYTLEAAEKANEVIAKLSEGNKDDR